MANTSKIKKIRIYYWIFTGILAALMVMSALPDIINDPQAVTMIHTHLGYPLYFIPFIGIAKILGVIALLIPGYPRIKEWAYAGFVYDLTGATFSMISVGDPVQNWLPMIIGFILIGLSYYFHHRKLRAEALEIPVSKYANQRNVGRVNS